MAPLAEATQIAARGGSRSHLPAEGARRSGLLRRVGPCSDFQKFGFFGFCDLVYLSDVTVRQLLKVLLRPFGFVLGRFRFFDQGFETVIGIAPDIANGYFA